MADASLIGPSLAGPKAYLIVLSAAPRSRSVTRELASAAYGGAGLAGYALRPGGWPALLSLRDGPVDHGEPVAAPQHSP